MSKQQPNEKRCVRSLKPAGAAENKPTEAVVKKTIKAEVKDFRIDAKNLFLTYPQCDIYKVIALKQVKGALFNRGVKYILVCKEDHHENDERKLPKYWGISSRRKKYHGHYEKVDSSVNVMKYVKKDGDWIEEGTAPVEK
ncbi:hypothetical protein EIN_004470 [Entamoeba invadens IP1]|uniref:CRESS-DNA virus Rep endonuclease domain-containing protein n=1 Tax=Entamoeba invadens IP1 TaxID=370355 RepID=L7FL16_ENTIV|nr:hypothetical protein EIN_004470 [Entamoeba invadens IP1]ELP86390.1 hypothetical protein EIN_004470 [Entamoeba invadens IP1]|eukprot:XP_004185736.1 hypothetical protein EIN_004470 [Entamoeba invadens IP1]